MFKCDTKKVQERENGLAFKTDVRDQKPPVKQHQSFNERLSRAVLMSKICTDKNLCLFLKDTVTVLLDLTAIMIFFPPGFK